MTANRRYITASVSMRDHRPRYGITRWPWCHIGVVKDLWKQKYISAIQSDAYGPKVWYSDAAEGLILRPTIDLAARTDTGWSVAANGTTQLESETDVLFGGEDGGTAPTYWRRQRAQDDGSGNPLVSVWHSTWQCCVNPFLLVALKRQAMPDDYNGATEPYTEIGFGVTGTTGISIKFPYRGSSYVRVYEQYGWNGAGWYPYQWTKGSLSFGREKDGLQSCLFAIGWAKGRLCVWDCADGSPNEVAHYAHNRAGVEEWLWCPESNVRLTHTMGELALSIRPLTLSAVQFAGPVLPVGVEDFLATELGHAVYGYSVTPEGYTNVVANNLSTFALGNTYGSIEWVRELTAGELCVGRVGEGDAPATLVPPQCASWFADMKPLTKASTFEDANSVSRTVTTYTSPVLFGVDLWQKTVLTDNGEPAETENLTTAKKVHTVELDEPERWSTAQARITLHNRHEQSDWAATTGLQLRQFNISGVCWQSEYAYPDSGWTAEAEYTFGKYWSFDPDFNDPRYVRLTALDLMGIIAMHDCGDEMFPGDGLLVSDSIRDWLYSCNIGDEMQSLETVGFTFPISPQPEERLWQPKRGVQLARFLQEVQEKAAHGGAIWGENGVVCTGCKYCGAKRTSENWLSHQDNGWASTACLATDVARAGADGVDAYLVGNATARGEVVFGGTVIEATVRRIGESILGRFANFVDVAGEDAQGRPMRAAAWDYDSVSNTSAKNYMGGFVVPHVEASGAFRTSSLINVRAQQLLNEKSENPSWIEATFPIEPGIVRGYVLGVYGWNNLGINGRKYRITQVSPPIVRGEIPLMKVRARDCGAIPA